MNLGGLERRGLGSAMTRFSSGASLHRGKSLSLGGLGHIFVVGIRQHTSAYVSIRQHTHLSLGGLDHILFVRCDVVGRLQHDLEALPRSFAGRSSKKKERLSRCSSLDYYSIAFN